MNKYGQAAIRAAELLNAKEASTPAEAWETATIEIFGTSSSQSKGCPKYAFLGLCETGRVRGVKAGCYTQSKQNKGYALKALELLDKDSTLQNSPSKLWKYVMDGTQKSHNSQMDVVLALWNSGYIIK